ncbi:hypothetical protein DL546_002324 [Coniochaeta pulveracea]|uniref:Thymocyte nuclear protein 1 n=1 Tax=Coniochaeta pulveracea TaxID=177199 RepID=A0A420Y5C1_9PEZI|nr:hypothetical protein DL546_002324 [Coniochaeta pulveracea]
MPKRKAHVEDGGEAEPLRRSTRQKSSAVVKQEPKPAPVEPTKKTPKKTSKKPDTIIHKPNKAAKPTKVTGSKPKQQKEGTNAAKPTAAATSADDGEEKNYWLMKAEPETRLEKGIDVRFSIDDLAAKTEPEPWDGIRNYVARNNLRAMKKGDLAFFYHSNCKEPGIVGTMEIVREHSPDLTAHDPKAPYHDPKSNPDDPKWSVVHVKFRSKFPVQVGLQELKALGAPGGPLENMQMIKQSRLSVSKVSAKEWKFLNELAGEKARKAEEGS